MKLAWLTDLHLNFVEGPRVNEFIQTVAACQSDAVLLGGDTGEAEDVCRLLSALANEVQRPVYLVLGNHDFYRGSIASVRADVAELCLACPNLHWLPKSGVVPLTTDACLVGHDGWGDGRLGNYHDSDVLLNDFGLISEFGGFEEDPNERLAKLHALGDEAAGHFRSILSDALSQFRHILVLTHVPPFREACWHQGRLSNEDWLPFFTCKAVGDVLTETMQSRPDRTMTVLCGHTHSAGETAILPNLRVLTGGVAYGAPQIQRILTVY